MVTSNFTLLAAPSSLLVIFLQALIGLHDFVCLSVPPMGCCIICWHGCRSIHFDITFVFVHMGAYCPLFFKFALWRLMYSLSFPTCTRSCLAYVIGNLSRSPAPISIVSSTQWAWISISKECSHPPTGWTSPNVTFGLRHNMFKGPGTEVYHLSRRIGFHYSIIIAEFLFRTIFLNLIIYFYPVAF